MFWCDPSHFIKVTCLLFLFAGIPPRYGVAILGMPSAIQSADTVSEF